jgi:AcrR family transcriptional regulator
VPRPPSDISHRIVEAARERFLREGVDGAALRRIADDAGTNIGMVYYYFKTKDELFLAVVEDVYQSLLADMVTALQPDVPCEQRLLRLYQRIAGLSDREFDVLRLILREALVSSARLTRIAQRFAQGHVPLVVQTLAEGLQQRRFDPAVDPLVMAAATASLAVLPQLVHRLLTAADVPIAAHLPDRAGAANALHHCLLFGIAGPALRETPGAAPPPVAPRRPRRRG